MVNYFYVDVNSEEIIMDFTEHVEDEAETAKEGSRKELGERGAGARGQRFG